MEAYGRYRPSRPYRNARVLVLAVIAAEFVVACWNLAETHWLTALWALIAAGGLLFLLRVIGQLVRINLVMIDQNARLLYAARHASEDTLTFERQDSPR